VGRKGIVLLLVVLAFGSCAAEPRRAQRPDPPGPIDALHMIWGDFSRLCPDDYDFCGAGGRSLCCPDEQGCCEDASGPHCCSSPTPYERDEWSERRYEDDDDDGRESGACSVREITCSHAGRTVCCASNHGCCAGADGPYCCASFETRDPD